MRMAADHLGVDVGAHVIDGELARISGDLGLQYDLQKHVTQLFAQVGNIVMLDGVDGLVSFFQHVVGNSGMRLGTIPWATVGRTQRRNGIDERIECRMLRRWQGFLLSHTVPFQTPNARILPS